MKLLIFLSLAFLCFSPCKAQKQGEAKPSVYVSYDNETKRASRCYSGEQVILQLHNNSAFYINVNADFNAGLENTLIDDFVKLPDGAIVEALKSGSDVRLCFDVESLYKTRAGDTPTKSAIPKIDSSCACSYVSNGKSAPYPANKGYWIKPQAYVKFAVPVKYLSKSLKIYTEYNYPWEFENGLLKKNEPKHRVYFYYFDMPSFIP